MLKFLTFLTIFALSSTSILAQTTANSPFSSYGIGEYGGIVSAQFAAMGNITGVSTDSTALNTYNPSSYGLLSKGQPLFGIGVVSRFSMFKSNGEKSNGFNTNFTNFTLAVPFGKRFGLGFGLVPLTRRGYDVTTSSYVYDDTLVHKYQGSGSINDLFLGFSYAPIRTERTELSIGAQGSFYFGNVSNNRLSYYNESTLAGGVQNTIKRVRSFGVNFGLTLRQFLDADKRQELVFGAIYSPQMKLKSYLDYGLYTTTDVTDYDYYDTLNETTTDGTIVFPSRQVFSIGYNFQPKTSENALNAIYSLGVFAEVEMMQWKNYNETFDDYTYSGLSNTFSTKIGMQFLPNTDLQSKTKGWDYFKKIKYRFGGFYGQNPMSYNGNQIKTSGVTFGMGIPFIAQKTNSSINFAIQYGKTGNGRAGDLTEQFFSLNLGIIIAPSSYERWFRKYKLD